VLGALFFVGEHFLFEGSVFGFVAAAGMVPAMGRIRVCVRWRGLASRERSRERGWRSWPRFVLTHAKGLNHVAHEEARRRFLRSGGIHVGRRVHGAQGAVEIEGRDAGLEIPALREHDLEDVSGGDVVFGAADAFEKFFLECAT